MILFGVFFIFPVLQSIFYSFTNWNGFAFTQFKGLNNYSYIFRSDIDFWNSFRFTVSYTIINTLMLNICALFLAKILTSGIFAEEKLRIAFFLPNMLSIVVVGIFWNFIFGPLSTEIFKVTQLAFFGLPWLSRLPIAVISVSIAQTWAALGWYTLIYIAGYQSVPREIYEACEVDGCIGFRRFLKVTIPLLMPSITINFFTSLTQGLQVFDLVFSLTSGGPGKMTETVIMNIYNTSFRSMYYGFGSAKTVILSIVVLVVGYTQIYFTRKKEVVH